MPTSAVNWLKDASEAGDWIGEFLKGVDLAGFRSSMLLRSAVNYQFVVISEALNALSKEHPAVAARISVLPDIVAFRNTLVHKYRIVEIDEVFRIAKEELPKLQSLLAEITADIASH